MAVTDVNKLIKDMLFDVTLGSAGTAYDPGQPYIPPQPARCYKRRVGDEGELVCEWEFIRTQGTSIYTTGEETGESLRKIYVCRAAETVYEEICTTAHPGQPYIPPTPAVAPTTTTVNKDFNVGWNGRARSMSEVGALLAGYASFKASPSSIGIHIGFTQNHKPEGYRDIRYGVFISKGKYKPMVNGSATGPARPFTQDSEFQLLLTDGFFRLSVVGTGHTSEDVHEIADPTMFTGVYVLSASMYVANDFVFEPEFYAASQGTAELSIEAIGGEGTYAMGTASLSSVTAWGIEAAFPTPITFSPTGPFSYGITTLGTIDSLGSDRLYAAGDAVLPEIEITAYTGLMEIGFAHAVTSLATMSSYGSGMTGEVGQGTTTFSNMESIGSEGSYGYSSNTLLPLNGYAHAYEGATNGFVYGFMGATATITAPAEIFVTLDASGQVVGAFTGQLVVPASVQGAAVATGAFTSEQVINLLLNASAIISETTGFGSLDDHDIWVMNRRTSAFTRYEQWNFKSYAELNDRLYGVRDDGIYLLEGSDDAGTDIEASINFGEMDFDTSALKRVDGCYAGMSSDGTMYLRVSANGQTYTFAARNVDEVLRTQRFDIGRGMKASFFAFELINSGGADFEIDGVEFIAVPLTRRIR